MPNLYKQLKQLLPDPPLEVGTVIAVTATTATIELPDGAIILARGQEEIGQTVYVRDGVIEGSAPSLPVVMIDL